LLHAPTSLHREIWERTHTVPGHSSKDPTLDVLLDRVYWPTMERDVAHWCSHCTNCLRSSTYHKPPKVLQNFLWAEEPMDTVSVDFVGPIIVNMPKKDKPIKRKDSSPVLDIPEPLYHNILTMVDYATHYAWCIPTVTQTKEEKTRVLYSLFHTFGFPKVITLATMVAFSFPVGGTEAGQCKSQDRRLEARIFSCRTRREPGSARKNPGLQPPVLRLALPRFRPADRVRKRNHRRQCDGVGSRSVLPVGRC